MLNLLLLVCGLIAGVAGLTVLYARHQRDTQRDAIARRSWAMAEGVVVHSKTREQQGGEGPACYEVDLVYTYSVDGRDRTGTRLRTGAEPRYATLHEAAAVALSYPPGSVVNVHYDPWNPTECALRISEPPSDARIRRRIATVAACASLGAALILLRGL